MSSQQTSARDFAQSLRVGRARLGIRQHELAEQAGISPAYLSQIETGKKSPSMEVLTRLAEALQTTPAQLLAGGEETHAPARSPRPEGGRDSLPLGPRIRAREDIEQALRSRTAVASIVGEARHMLETGHGERLGRWATVATECCALLDAYADNAYRAVPWESLVLMAAALAYVSEPDDVSPDHLEQGHIDDMAVLAFTESLVRPDLEDFATWRDVR